MQNPENRNLSPASRTLRKPNMFFGLAFKVTALIVLLILLVASVTTFIIYTLGINALHEETKSKLTLIVSNATVALDVDKLPLIQSQKDEGNETYMYLQKQLQAIKRASMGKIRFVYTVAKKGNHYSYVMDAEPIEDKDNHSPVGSDFDIAQYPVAPIGFSHPVAEDNPTFDKDFHIYSQSAYAPIHNRQGQVIGMLGVDMDVTTIQKDEHNMKAAAGVALLISSILAIGLGIAFSMYLTKPIFVMTDGTRKVAEGDLDSTVVVPRSDEFGQLADAFNTMTRDLKLSHETLKQYNLELEDKVTKRTAELSIINREIKDILDNMSQGILTIDRDLVFNNQHSKFTETIFGNMVFSNRNILDVFFAPNEENPLRDDLGNWLKLAFGKSFMKWEDFEALQPVKEIPVKTQDEAGLELIKYIQVTFQPIIDILPPEYKEQVTKIMVIVQDITDKKVLEQEMVQKEQEYKDNINQIVEIIRADQELFEDFVSECKEQIINVEPKLIALKEDKDNMELVNDLFRIMHTIKGNSRMFNLERIAGEAHGIENIFSAIRKGEAVMTDEKLDECFKKLDRFNTIFNEILDIYQKIVQGKNLDHGKTRTEKRLQEESEVIKVKVDEIHRLTELFKKMDQMVQDDHSKHPTPDKEKMSEIENLFKETEKQLQALRKVAVGRLFNRFPRMVRDMSMTLGKKVKLIAKGEEVEVDKNIFDRIADPMIHLIRNSLDHGLETPQERMLSGKPEEGTLLLDISSTETELSIVVADDGRGLDAERIKAKAVSKNLISADSALKMPDEEAINLIFLPGFSTSEKVTDISGRGVGMDVVKTYIEEKLNGKVILQSQLNIGLKVTLKVPLIS